MRSLYNFRLSETTREEQRHLLLFNALWQELAAIKNRGAATHFLPLLLISQPLAANSTQQEEDSTQLLLLVKKWTEFLARYKGWMGFDYTVHCLYRQYRRNNFK